MKHADIKAMMAEIAPVIREFTETAVQPVMARLDALEKQLSSLPAPRDGRDGADGRDGLNGERGSDGKDGRDGLDVKDLFRAEGGRLVAVMSDGTTKDLGEFVGKDGAAGKDGKDGFSLDDFDAELMDDGRTILLSFARGDTEFKVELGIPAMIYRGVYSEGRVYERGDTVTWGGSLWHCDEAETSEKPDSPAKHWTLAAKRGRDGKVSA